MYESKIEMWYCRKLRALGIEALKVLRAGWPDRACIADGRVVFVEFKRNAKCRPTPQQECVHDAIRNIGCDVLVISQREEQIVRKILEKLGKITDGKQEEKKC